MTYRVCFVDDAKLNGRDWLLCQEQEDGATLFIRRGARKRDDEEMERLLEQAWCGFRKIKGIPEQKTPLSA